MSSLYTSNESITQAFLPTRGMRFAGAGDVRVHDFGAGRNSQTQLQQRPANTTVAAYPPATSGSSISNGSISGGALRPGSIDQTQFKAMLAAAQSGVPGTGISANGLPAAPSSGLLPLAPNAALAAQGLRPNAANSFSALNANAAAGAGSSIQTLTPAQFAALTGGSSLPGVPAQSGVTPDRTIPAAAQVANLSAASPARASAALAAQNGAMDTLTLTDAAIPPDSPDQGQQASLSNPGQNPSAGQGTDDTPIGSFDKNGVLVLNITPDKDMRQEYAAKGIKWRLVDNPDSNKLFFGPDGKLGWKDALDLINPLQHIPLVNIAYRHFTGDVPNGAAELLGAIPFGPLSTLAAVTDLAVRSTTGKDIGENAIALLTGGGNSAQNVAQSGNKNDVEMIAEVTPDQKIPEREEK